MLSSLHNTCGAYELGWHGLLLTLLEMCVGHVCREKGLFFNQLTYNIIVAKSRFESCCGNQGASCWSCFYMYSMHITGMKYLKESTYYSQYMFVNGLYGYSGIESPLQDYFCKSWHKK